VELFWLEGYSSAWIVMRKTRFLQTVLTIFVCASTLLYSVVSAVGTKKFPLNRLRVPEGTQFSVVAQSAPSPLKPMPPGSSNNRQIVLLYPIAPHVHAAGSRKYTVAVWPDTQDRRAWKRRISSRSRPDIPALSHLYCYGVDHARW